MLILYGVKHKMEKEVWAGVDTCTVCNVNRDRYLARRRTAVTLFYVPVFWFDTGRYIVTCEACQIGAKLEKKDYNKMRDALVDAYKDGKFPVRVVNSQYTKKQLGIAGKTARVVLAWIIAIFAGFIALTSGADALLAAINGYSDSSSALIALIATVFGIPQLFTSHARLFRAIKMLRTAKIYEGKVDEVIAPAPAAPAVEETAPVEGIETPAAAPAVAAAATAAAVVAAAAEEAAPAAEEAAPAAE